MKTNLLSLVFPIFLFPAFFNADDFTTKLANKLVAYQNALPQEKAFIHTDKPYYSVGDSIWLKAYLTVGSQNSLDTISKVIYIDLVNEATGKVAVWHRFQLKNGMAAGVISLADSMEAGKYILRGYNNWMRNFSSDFFFQKKVSILKNTPDLNAPDTTQFDVQFFPEGGNLVAGLNNRLGYKAINSFGQGIAIEGFVSSSSGDTLTTFTSGYLGMGTFNLMPEPNKQYFAVVKHGQGAWKKIELPEANQKGFAVQIDNFGNKNNVRAIISNNIEVSATDEATIVVYGQGEIKLAAKFPLSKRTSLINIPRAALSEGMSFITIFDQKQKPVAERLVWAKKVRPLNVSLKSNKQNYTPHEKIEVELMVNDADQKPVEASFSLAATDLSQVSGQHPHDLNIVSYLHLTSDLKGNIEKPSYYFDTTQVQAAFHLDYLLMTQGWRRFRWEQVMADSLTNTKYLIESGLNLSGNVTKLNKKSAGKVILNVIMTEKDGTRSVIKQDSDEGGKFEITNLVYSDTAQFYIQAATPKDNRDLLVNVDKTSPPTFEAQPTKTLDSQELTSLKAYLQNMAEYRIIEEQIRKSGEKLLGEVVVKGKKAQIKDNRKIYTKPASSLSPEQLKDVYALNPIEALQGRVSGVQVTGAGMSVKVNIRSAANFGGSFEPLYLLDGIPTDLQTLINTPMSMVESIDVLKQSEATVFGSRGAGGVIAVLTKRGNPNYDFSKDTAPGTASVNVVGYAPVREFYSPTYYANITSSRPDLRSTLYWNPSVRTDTNGKAKLSFYNSDKATNIYISTNGISNTGQTGAGVCIVK